MDIDDKTAKQYDSLTQILSEALNHASQGKGHVRHGSDEPFENQVSCEITQRLSKSPVAYPLGQAVKKIYETTVLDKNAQIHELLGAINFLAIAIICLRGETR